MAKRRTRVLLADAEPNFARVLRLALEKRGCEVHVATDGLEALARVREQAYDLVIADAGLPVMDGLQVMALCADARPKVPMIVTSSYEVPWLRQQAADAGAYAFVVKPSDGARLAGLAELVVAGGRTRRAVSRASQAALQRLKPGCEITLHVASGQHAGTYSSRFLESHRRFLAVAGPQSAQGAVSIEMGARVSIVFGLPTGWHTFTTRVVGEDAHRRPVRLLLEPPRSVLRRQRRRQARVAAGLPVIYRPVRAGARSARARMLDVCAAGMGVLMARRLEVGTPLALSVVNDSSGERFDLPGEVVWTARRGRLWRTGIKFLASSGAARRVRARLVAGLQGGAAR